MSEFKPGLEGVVAFETEIAEPDRDGGALRYRGVDIEDLVGIVPFEKVWGLLVDDEPEPGLQPAAPYAALNLTGNAPADLQAITAHLSGEWGLGQLIDISDAQARDDLSRLSATMISIVAQSARVADGNTTPVDPELVASGATAATRFLLEWRGEADPKHVQRDRHLLDLHRRARAQRLDVHGPHCRVDGRGLRSLARVRGRRTLGPAPRRGACAGAADARRRSGGRVDRGLRQAICSTRGDRLMGFGHRVYRAEDPRARLLRGTAMDLGSPRFRVAEELERAALAELHARKPDRVLATNVEFWSAVVLDVAEIPPKLAPAMFACSRTAGWSAHVMEQKRLGPARPPGGELRRSRPAAAPGRLMDLAQAAALADEYAGRGLERELATLRDEWGDEIESAARDGDYRVRALAYRSIAQFRFRQKLELLRRGFEDDSPAVRGSALIALEGLSRAHPGDVNAYRPLLHELAARDPNVAVRRLAIVCFKNGTPARETIVILDGIAGDDETDAEVRKTAKSVALLLVKKSNKK